MNERRKWRHKVVVIFNWHLYYELYSITERRNEVGVVKEDTKSSNCFVFLLKHMFFILDI